MSTAPRLLHFRVSHYNEKVRWALDFKRWPHVREDLVPGFHVPRVRSLTGQNQVPVLVLDGKPICGSAAILTRIEAERPEPRLFPEDPALRSRALALQAHFDDEVGPELRSLFWAGYFDRSDEAARVATQGFSNGTRRAWRFLFPFIKKVFVKKLALRDEMLARARQRFASHVDRIAAEVGPSGYLVGDSFSVADLAVCSIMAAVLRPPEFPYALPEPQPPELTELRASVADRPGARWVREMYAKHRGTSCAIV